jgi:hypothetical protein
MNTDTLWFVFVGARMAIIFAGLLYLAAFVIELTRHKKVKAM